MNRRATRIRYAILGLLHENGDASLATLTAVLGHRPADTARALDALERARAVVGSAPMSVNGGPPRRYYRLPHDDEQPECPCGCPVVGDMCSCGQRCPCGPDCGFCDPPTDGP